ncbi:hypothetical protein [Deinococcus sp. PEB2-63]
MNELFSGVTVQLFSSPTQFTLRSPGLPGLTCTVDDLWQIHQLLNWHLSGTVTLDDGTPLTILLLEEMIELRQEDQVLVRVTPDVPEGSNFNDMSALHMTLGDVTHEVDEDATLKPTYGFLLEGLDTVNSRVPVWNAEPRVIGDLTSQDLPPLRALLAQGAGAQYLTKLHVEVGGGVVTLSPDNRPIPLKPGQRQLLNLQDPLVLTLTQAQHLANDAEFLLTFSGPSVP